jgi:hypothetical protein
MIIRINGSPPLRVVGYSSRRGLFVSHLDGKGGVGKRWPPRQTEVFPSEEFGIPKNCFPLRSIVYYLKNFFHFKYGEDIRKIFEELIENSWPKWPTPHGTMYKVKDYREMIKMWRKAEQVVKEKEAKRLEGKRKRKPKCFCYFCGAEFVPVANAMEKSCSVVDKHPNPVPGGRVRFCTRCGKEIPTSKLRRCSDCIQKAAKK